FALPFAFSGMLAAARGWPGWSVVLLVIACMVTARTAAMTWNRIADRDVDAKNPRTAQRALPAGRVSLVGAWTLLLVSAVGFAWAAASLNRLTLILAPVALAVVLFYSLTKRFTWACHFVLGLSLSIAPIGAWIAVRGRLDVEVLWLGLGVLLWTAGFDTLYACQDADFDRDAGLRSLPARFGVARALLLARACHVGAAIALVVFGPAWSLGWPYLLAVGLAAGVMAWSHSLVSADDLSRVGVAFFQANVTVSVLVLVGVIGAVVLG
ncbi:MAG: 4-hydroxybenzoate octaprenyltransferase, partial [Acidobacteriota bacterium]